MLINNAGVLQDARFRQEFVYYETTGQYVDRKWVESQASPAVGSGSVQPVSKTEFHELVRWTREGARIDKAILVITDVELKACENGDIEGSTGHTVWYDGYLYKVVDVEDYGAHGHYEAIAARLTGSLRTPQPEVA